MGRPPFAAQSSANAPSPTAPLMVAAAVAFPMPPGGDVSPAADPTWLAAHVGPVIAQSSLRAAGALAFAVLAVALAGLLRGVGRAVFAAAGLAGGTLTAGLLLVAQAGTLAAAMLSRAGGGADVVRAVGALGEADLDMSSLPAVVLFAAVGGAAWRTGLLPRWITVLTLIGVPVALLDALSYDGGPFAGLGVVGLVFFLAWSLLVGGALLARPAPLAGMRP